MKFEEGKTYRVLNDSDLYDELEFLNGDKTFTVREVDNDGDPWSTDVKWRGKHGLFCVSERGQLSDEDVELVEP